MTQPTDQHFQQIHEALLSAFAFDELRMLTRTRLNVDLEAIVPVQGRNLTAMTYDLIRVCAAQGGGLAELIRAAGDFAPDNPLVRAMVAELGDVDFEVLPQPEGFAGGKVIHGDEVHGDKFEGDKVAGDKIAGDKVERKIVYEGTVAQPVDDVELTKALARLNEMPTDSVPAVSHLPHGSFLPHSPNPHFVGRQADLMRLARSLKGDDPDAVAINQIASGSVSGVTGLGGMGKTQLATAFAHRYGGFFGGGVFWVSFADPAGIESEIAKSAVNIMPAGFGTQELSEQVRQVAALWQSPLPRLLIFDNCEDPALLAQWKPPTGGARVLVTSRRANWDAALDVETLALGTLPREESVALLEAHLTPNPSQPPPGLPLERLCFTHKSWIVMRRTDSSLSF